ncbi:hypothetical protein ART_0162 [Arthrobacter sp. PAMC 25486]|uniref:hypothetical protein n=1 Tax=Arthrobacter sp. PAMC 25486 TaxID=1494608 RepID=UPI0005362058|nr:hypothetical protein [Arthrobacter sp. PAMC 25486]AIX99760.1 hypothetical protein ART_0162 [Arthrobacter sp. PAMC 25486]
MSIIIRSNQLMGSAPMVAPYAPGRQLYRANFNDGNKASLAGEVTATDVGLVRGTWEGNANNFAVQNSTVVRGSTAGSIGVGLPLLGAGAMMSWDVITVPQGAPVYLDLFASTVGGSPDVYRLGIGTTASSLSQRVANASTVLSPLFATSNGDRVGIRWVGGLLTAFVNGIAVAEAVTSAVNPNGFARLSAGSGATGFALDTMAIEIY